MGGCLAQAMLGFAVAPISPARIEVVGLNCAHGLVALAVTWLSLPAPTQSQSWGCQWCGAVPQVLAVTVVVL